jgi:hypothetical protein
LSIYLSEFELEAMLSKEGTPKKKATNSIDKRTKPKYGSLAAFWRRLFYISTYWNSFPKNYSHQPDFLTSARFMFTYVCRV